MLQENVVKNWSLNIPPTLMCHIFSSLKTTLGDEFCVSVAENCALKWWHNDGLVLNHVNINRIALIMPIHRTLVNSGELKN